ncbi:MAG: class I SAM-dependent methyltransferase [Candidatus Aenigmatarchaeota archaeon]
MGPGAKVLDLGCGFGITSEILKELGYKVVGIDISKRMVEHCRERY